MTEYPDLGIPHKCNVREHCNLNQDYKIWFCSVCRDVKMVEVNGALHQFFIKEERFKQEDLSEETKKELV